MQMELRRGLLNCAAMDWAAIALSLRLASVVSIILLAIGVPLAYWLTFSSWRGKFLVESLVALPLVLPPTVLGFYVLVALGSRSPIGRAWEAWTGHGLAFTFEGWSSRPFSTVCRSAFSRSPRRSRRSIARCSKRRRSSAPANSAPSGAS